MLPSGVWAGMERASQPLLAGLSGAPLPWQEGRSNSVQEGAAGSAELRTAQQRPSDELHHSHRGRCGWQSADLELAVLQPFLNCMYGGFC